MNINLTHTQLWRLFLLTGLAWAIIFSLGLVHYYRSLIFLALPPAIIIILWIVYNYKPLFYLLIATIPISYGFELPGNLTLDLPSEPLMLIFLFIFIVRVLSGKQFSLNRKLYTFHILVFLILFWTFFSTLISAYPIRSLKFLLAKIWYLAAFVYMAEYLITDFKTIQRIFWAFFISLILTIIFITIQHALEGFSFETSHNIVNPPYANGVIYASTLILFMPFAWYARSWYTPKSFEWYICWIGFGLIMLGIVLSYKRAAWAAVVMWPIIVIAIKRKWYERIIYAGLLLVVLALGYLLKDNNFYQFAPNYQQTIWHKGDLEGHLTATFQGKEISSMERFYRWVAAKNMVEARPFTGFGPSTFNQVYKKYADDAFRTYVSDNPEQSTTHNYFLMTFTEQGAVGGLLFIALCIFMMIKSARLYHQLQDERLKRFILTLLLSFSIMIFLSLLNELLEVDKVGAMFWLILLMIHKIQVWHEEQTATS